MGFFTKNKKVEQRMVQSELVRMVTGYQPAFSTYAGGLYEMGLTVSAIDAFARHVSKANPKIKGSAYKTLGKQWQVRMNDTMTTQQFLYRLATIWKCENNAFIIPIYDKYNFIVGLYPISSIGSSITTVDNELMLTYILAGKRYAIPYSEVGHMRNHQYKSELYGDGNQSLYPTLAMLDTQNQGIVNGIKQSAIIRFLARLGTQQKDEDIIKMRDNFAKSNLTSENNGGVAFYDSRIAELKQVESKPFIVDAEQQKIIEENVFDYIGVNKKIMQNDFTEEVWGSFYEGSVEPFLLQLGQIVTSMLFTNKELAFDNYCVFESTRLQHASTQVKWQMVTEGTDRGIFTANEGRELMNLPPIEGGDVRYIRLEYGVVSDIGKTKVAEDVEKPI